MRDSSKQCALFGNTDKVDVDVAAVLEEFVCCLYGLKDVSHVNDGRLYLFKKLYATEKQDDLLRKLNLSDACCLLPCRAVLEERIKRTNYVAFVWKHARKAEPVHFWPVGYGWRVNENNKLKIVWFEGPPMPEKLSLEAVESDEKDGPEEGECDSEEDMILQNLSSDEEESVDDSE